MSSLQIDDYFEAVALYRLLLSYKYAPNPLHREIFGSPFVAAFHKRLAYWLSEIESQRGNPTAAAGWTPAIEPDSRVWNLLIDNTVAMSVGNGWVILSAETKRTVAANILTPFVYDEATLGLFVQQLDTRLPHADEK